MFLAGVSGPFGREASVMRYLIVGCVAAALAIVACGPSEKAAKEELPDMEKPATMAEPPFGGPKDVAYAEALWARMEELGFNTTPGTLQPGESPHGAVIEILEGTIDGNKVIAKRNYGGEGVSVDAVEADRAAFLAAVTVMAKREEGYDPDNFDWFWVKYGPDGTVDANPQGMALAGRVAKGMEAGCIACHQGAVATEMVFAYAEGSELEVTAVETPVETPMEEPATE
jgi:hypothetical protein